MLDYIRIACAVPPVKVADVKKNAEDICAYIAKADAENADIVLFPELALTGYTCGDLFFQDALQEAVFQGLEQILSCSAGYPKITAVLGMPLRLGAGLYNCAAVICGGELRGLSPKIHIPGEEKRWFSSGSALKNTVFRFGAQRYEIPVKTDLLLELGDGAIVGIEICEDLMAPAPVSTDLSLMGAEVILNLSASPETAGKRNYRRALVQHQSGSCNGIYAYCSAGYTESTSDAVFCGHSLICENGRILKENNQPVATDYLMVCDCDLGKIRADRRRNQYFGLGAANQENTCLKIGSNGLRADGRHYALRKLPFVPTDPQMRKERCLELFQLQVTGLKQRLSTIRTNAVIGISGGLDSTLALLVAVEAMRQLGRPASDVYGVTMPCFGTSDRTYRNAWELMQKLGIQAKEINIKEAVSLHFQDIGHDITVHNGTYENSQARERTQILMDYASVVGGIVVGTGDLSELALGWCTYNGDHMSMYGVNAGIPKTLIGWMIGAVQQLPSFAAVANVLQDIVDTPISPELLPPDAQGKISQQTEDLVGPYALHDFYLYHVLRFGFTPKKIYTLACRAFAGEYDGATVKKWLKTFYRRFFTQQFKRNCMPDGVKVGSIGLGPRGDWRMPSDASAAIWLEEAETL